MTYPHVMTEDETLEAALKGRSLSRFGDGELRLTLGGTASAQRTNCELLKVELRSLLQTPQKALVCIPNLHKDSPKYENWKRYATPLHRTLYRMPLYGSAFITRPDSAPWIDRPDYWMKMRELWSGKEVTLVHGTARSLTPEMVARDAKSVRHVQAPAENAYAQIDDVERRISTPGGLVILCLGPTATLLAARLANKGVHAVDLGHVGMFMRRRGILV